MRLFYDIIADKRDKKTLSKEDISDFLQSYLDGTLKDYQMSAMLMAVFFNSLNDEELETWTEKMLYSGEVLDFSDLDGFVVDKHSTGGVGDKISIPLAPLLAELGFYVPMISGRGLGHTGGTLDKLESIPGFSVNIDKESFKRSVRINRMALIGQTPEIAPLDKRLYALRDVTGTVESVPLIASSIMSKKLAEGINGLILDIKIGEGAFMKDLASGTRLAKTMQAIGKRFGRSVDVLFTNMDEPLGYTVGNALEIKESLDVMQGKYVPQVTELTLRMAAVLMKTFKMTASIEEGEEKAAKMLHTGRVLERFASTIKLQGGDPKVASNQSLLPESHFRKEVKATESGVINKINALDFGKALIRLGGGRLRQEDSVNKAVGFVFAKKAGEKVTKGDLLYTIHFDEEERLKSAEEYLKDAVIISEKPAEKARLILGSL
ncbi:thymidine phosphorylase [bacterium]|nr:thymidine phosphorylase [bacterium]